MKFECLAHSDRDFALMLSWRDLIMKNVKTIVPGEMPYS